MAKIKRKTTVNKKTSIQRRLKKTRLNYAKENLILAVNEAQSGKSVAEVSRKYNVPESTVRARKTGKYQDKKPGPATVLSSEEENQLVEWIFLCSKRGFPVTKHQLLESVKLLCDHDKRTTPFSNNMPGRAWFEGFLRRHQNVSQRLSENVSLSRAKVTEYNIRSWFREVKNYLNEENLFSIHSSRVFNADETAVAINPKPPTVLSERGSKNVYNIVNNEKENVTVLVTGNAAGNLAPSLILFAGKSIPRDVSKAAPPNFSFGYSDNGWMTARNFYEYIANVFYPWVKQNRIEFPIILYVDGHCSHITLMLSQFCQKNKIVLIALYPNSTHLLQPLDVSFFKPFKVSWQKCNKSFCESIAVMSIKKCQFALVLEKTFQSLNIKEILSNGFITCGLYPFNENAIDFSKVFKNIPATTNESCNSEDIITNQKTITLQNLETLIEPDVLQSFKQHIGSHWTGREADKSLFEVWFKLDTSIMKQVEIAENIQDIPARVEEDNISNNGILLELFFETPNIQEISNLECAQNVLNPGLNTISDDQANVLESKICIRTEPEVAIDTEIPTTSLIHSESEVISEKVPIVVSLNSQPSINSEPEITSNQTSSLKNPEITFDQTSPLKNITNNHDAEKAKFPETFQEVLFWPKCDLTKKGNKRTNKVKTPSVLSSTQWQLIQESKENEKEKKIEDAVLRKKIKAEKQECIKREKEEKILKKEEERLRKEEIKLKKEKEKILKQQERIQKMEYKKKEKEESLIRKKESSEIKEKIAELQTRQEELIKHA